MIIDLKSEINDTGIRKINKTEMTESEFHLHPQIPYHTQFFINKIIILVNLGKYIVKQ